MRKRAQEEMVGFMAVILVVAIIILVFLGIFVRQDKPSERADSTEISQFLQSALEYTTECSPDSGYSYLNLESLISRCTQGTSCSSGDSCEKVIEETFEELILSSWNFGPESPNKGYRAEVLFVSSAGSSSTLAELLKGTCSSSRRGADIPISSQGGTTSITLELCI